MTAKPPPPQDALKNENRFSAPSLSAAIGAIVPAIAIKPCCWGPAVLSVFGAAGSSTPLLSKVARYRPYLLGLSSVMIGYSFYDVYGPPSRKQLPSCCQSEAQQQAHAQQLATNRTVVWASLAVAVAGAAYGRRVPVASSIGAMNGGSRLAQVGENSAASASLMRLQVGGMSCGGCASKVRGAIESISGVENVVVDHKTGEAVVKGAINRELVKKAITRVGFNVGA